jgi:cell division septation protein DedD
MYFIPTERPTGRVPALALALLASASLLSGCAIWPKALTFHSDSAETQEVPAATTPAAEAAPAPVAVVEPKAEAPIAVVAEAPKVEPVKVERPVPLPAMRLPEAAPSAEIRSGGTNGVGRGIYINVGLFSVPSNGVNAYQKLDQAGMPVFLDSVQSKKKGTLSRVRVGPFASRAEAQTAAKKIHALKLDAVVVQL